MRKRNVKKALQSFAVITGSMAEYRYFQQMKKDCRYRNMLVEYVEVATLEELVTKAQHYKLRNRVGSAWAVASLKQYGKTADSIEEELHLARKKKVNLAFADPSIMLYFALCYEVPPQNSAESVLKAIVCKKTPDFDFTEDYLLHAGTEFHLSLFKYKAKAGLNESEYNRVYGDNHNEAKAINFMAFLNDVAEYCGEGDVAYNQKTID